MGSLHDAECIPGGFDQCIAKIAARQHGVFNRMQAMRCGGTKAKIRWRIRVGRWKLTHPNVFLLGGSTRTWRQELMAACLYMGAHTALSHRAAAALSRLAGIKRARTEVTVPRNRNRTQSDDIIIHWLREPIPPEDITTIDGIRVTKPARTLIDLATVEPLEVIERCLDDALRRKLVSLSFLERWLADPRRKGHRGTPILRRLVEERATTGVTESPLESQVLQLLRSGELPIPMLQYVVEVGTRSVRLDFAYPDAKVGIEADGFQFHDRRDEFDDERARGNELEAMGWHILRITAKHLERNPDEVVEWVRRALKLEAPSSTGAAEG
jgi:very-short-patch-repair endonuclease